MTPPNLSEQTTRRSLRDGGATQHRLWWKPGTHGKGILFDSGVVHTWPEGEGDHQHCADRHWHRTGVRATLFFRVHPTGEVRIPVQHAGNVDRATAALRDADSRLRPFVTHTGSADPARERLARVPAPDRQRWLMLQRRGRSLAI
jgi:hypothetical protein